MVSEPYQEGRKAMSEYTVRRPDGSDPDREASWAAYLRYDDDSIADAKESAVNILASELGIDSEPADWVFNPDTHGTILLHTLVDELRITAYVTGDRIHHDRIFAAVNNGQGSTYMEEWVPSLEALDDAISRNRYSIEHPYQPGPYDNMG